MDERLEALSDRSTAVLIVDDNIQYTQVLRRMLEAGLGYSDVTSVESAEKAYELISNQPKRFKLLFVDYNFPDGTSGGKLLERLNSNSLLDDKVAFLITSEPTADNLKEAVQAGALGVVAKPFDRSELKRQLDKAHRAIIVDSTEGF